MKKEGSEKMKTIKTSILCWHAAFSSFETVAICLSSEDWDFIVIPAAEIFRVPGDFALVASL